MHLVFIHIFCIEKQNKIKTVHALRPADESLLDETVFLVSFCQVTFRPLSSVHAKTFLFWNKIVLC